MKSRLSDSIDEAVASNALHNTVGVGHEPFATPQPDPRKRVRSPTRRSAPTVFQRLCEADGPRSTTDGDSVDDL